MMTMDYGLIWRLECYSVLEFFLCGSPIHVFLATVKLSNQSSHLVEGAGLCFVC